MSDIIVEKQISLEPTAELLAPISALFRLGGLRANILSIQNYTNGRNNRTYRVQTDDSTFVVKHYLRQEGDTRDRLSAEYSFLSYAQDVASNYVARPYCQDEYTGMALYEFIDGLPFQPGQLTESDVIQAAHFFCQLNTEQAREHAKILVKPLPIASEACFSIAAHFDLIAARIQQLKTITPTGLPEDAAAIDLIQRLDDKWKMLMSNLSSLASATKINIADELDESQRCVSPSDFGFHNALKMADGSIRFLDFEYAGWDDPAKMTGDFFAQLAIPVPAHLFDGFVNQVMQSFRQSEWLERRAHLLRLVYRIKWCCIALNIFLPVHQARYQFANKALDVLQQKRQQIMKVHSLLDTLKGEC